MPARVVCVGAALQEVYLSNSPVFKPVRDRHQGDFAEIKMDSMVEVERVDIGIGGGALNAAVTFARHGLDVSYMGEIGHDLAGQAVLDLLDREGISRELVQYSHEHHTGHSVILLSPEGERAALVHHGAAGEFKNLDIDALSGLSPDWVYVTTLSGDLDTLRRLFARCAKIGARVVFNPGELELKNPNKLKPLLEDVEVLICDMDEAKQVVAGTSLDELAFHALNLVKVISITAGANGSIVSDGKTVVRAGLYEDVKVVDRTGAGDAFGSGLLTGLVEGKALKDAVLFASANAASVISHVGAQSGILRNGVQLHDMPTKETKLR
ncbi:MAG: carbohydrate kinase family protein [Candidatus Nomurabacteria bacterium]|jgi:ribokinase|nr:carbohydrate kinase family protein [Candidatus Nomurabacteria bacterium]